MQAEITRVINAPATSVAISPSGNFIAFTTANGVYVDDGKPRRFVDMFANAVGLIRSVIATVDGKWSVVCGVTDDGVAMYATTSQVCVVGRDGKVRQLLGPTSGHRPYLCYNAQDHVLTVLCDTAITQFDTNSWAVLRTIDLSEEIDHRGYVHCSADGDWIIAQSAGYIVVVGAGGFECMLPAARRYRAVVGAGLLAGPWNTGVAKSTVTWLPSDGDPQVWEGAVRAWCPVAGEFRGTDESGALVTWTPDGTATVVDCAPSARTSTFAAVEFSPSARRAARFSPVNHNRNNRGIEVLGWR